MGNTKHVSSSEYKECQAFWEISQYNPILRDYLIHIPNEGERSFSYYAALKSIGFRVGIPDYVLIYPNKRFHSLWFDMKFNGRKGTPAQDAWLARLNAAGHLAVYTYSADEAYKLCLDYISDKL